MRKLEIGDTVKLNKPEMLVEDADFGSREKRWIEDHKGMVLKVFRIEPNDNLNKTMYCLTNIMDLAMMKDSDKEDCPNFYRKELRLAKENIWDE